MRQETYTLLATSSLVSSNIQLSKLNTNIGSLTLAVFLYKSPRTMDGAPVTVLVLIMEKKKIKMMECFTAQLSNESGTMREKFGRRQNFVLVLEII
jgi:hypothetical protein